MKEIEKKSDQEIELSNRKNFLASFQERYKEEFLPASWTDEEKEQLVEVVSKRSSTRDVITAIPMICRPTCEYRKNCPLWQIDKAPYGSPCPLEFKIVMDFMGDFIETLNVDPTNLVEITLVRDMVNAEVQILRATKLLAQESFIQENVVGVDADGDPIMQKQLHLAADLEERLHKRKQALNKNFLATRESAAKAGMVQVDSAEGMASLNDQFRKFKQEQEEQFKAKLGIIDEDDYVKVKILDAETVEDDEE